MKKGETDVKRIGKRTVKKGALDPTRWGWKVASQEQAACMTVRDPFGKASLFRKHLFHVRRVVKGDSLLRFDPAGKPILLCRRCGTRKDL